jgi:hypothetical protein
MNNMKRCEMAENKVENYIETREELEKGHTDVRENNFRCENPDPKLGCDPGIDVAG